LSNEVQLAAFAAAAMDYKRRSLNRYRDTLQLIIDLFPEGFYLPTI